LLIIYICEPLAKKPPFLPEKALSLGLKPGPQYSDLKNGKSVFIGDREIKPSDVLGTAQAVPCIMLLYSLTIEHALILSQKEIFNNFFIDTIDKDARIVSNIIHIIGDEHILSNDSYKKFMNLFGPNVEHIIDCPKLNYKFMLNDGSFRIKYILSKVNNELFNISKFNFNDTLPQENLQDIINQNNSLQGLRISSSYSGYDYHLYPLNKRGMISPMLHEPFIYENKSFKEFQEKVDKLCSNYQSDIDFIDKNLKSVENTNFNNEPEVTYLGIYTFNIYRNGINETRRISKC